MKILNSRTFKRINPWLKNPEKPEVKVQTPTINEKSKKPRINPWIK